MDDRQRGRAVATVLGIALVVTLAVPSTSSALSCKLGANDSFRPERRYGDVVTRAAAGAFAGCSCRTPVDGLCASSCDLPLTRPTIGPPPRGRSAARDR